MDIKKRNRSELKSYFVKNSIPTESNFSDLIDAGLNQKEDGIAKPAGDPLSIEAAGDASGLQKLVNFYASFQDANPAWTFQLNPRSDAGNPATAKPGFCLSNGQGQARLFIDQNTGNVGIGTITPSRSFDVKANAIKLGLEGNGGGQLILANNRDDNCVYMEAFSKDGTGHASEFLLTGRAAENVPKLSLRADTTTITGNLGVGTQVPKSSLEIRKDASGALGPVLTLSNNAGSAGAGTAVDFNTYDVGNNPPSVRIQTQDDGNYSGHLLFLSKENGAANKPLRERLRILSNGKVGIGTTEPRTALDTGSGVMSGAANDYQKAQFSLSGGGLVTWGGPGGRLKWTARFIGISMERTKTFASGYVDIVCPTNPALVTAFDGSQRVDATLGIQLNHWEALYAVHEVGGDNSKVTFQIVVYNSGVFHAPSNWILVAVVNGDDNSIKLGTGTSIGKDNSYAAAVGNGLPKGAIIMWSGDTAPAGWALCDGQNGTPDLRGRFVLAAGAASGLTARKRGDVGGEEKHLLSQNEMPSHTHGVSDPGHYHNWTGSRQEAGTDDHNNTQEFSKGDAGRADTVSKNTDSRATGISINAAGGGAAHENMPPFYALAFIMKL